MPFADVILKNGIFHTLSQKFPVVESLAVAGGKVIALGPWAALTALAGSKTKVLDLQGAFAYPGFIDAHAHLYWLGERLDTVNLAGTSSEQQVLDKVAAAAASTTPGNWIIGQGWDQNRWMDKRFPNAAGLSRVAPVNPVALTRIDCHALWCNQAAMQNIKESEAANQIPGGEIILEEQSRPTGVFIDNAMELIHKQIPPPTAAEIKHRLKKAMAMCAAYGLTQVHDAGVGPEMMEIYKEMAADGELTIRVWTMLEDNEEWLKQILPEGIRQTVDGVLSSRSVKLFADGALGSRGAWLLEPYTDRPLSSGFPVASPEHVEKIARLCLSYGFQTCTHAIGDRAVRETLNAYERAQRTISDGTQRRFRIEHAQVLTEKDLPRFNRLGVIPSMQPAHATSDMDWAVDRLGAQRCRLAYALGQVLRSGCIVPTGSDFPVEEVNPLLGYFAAITRTDHHGRPPGGWFGKEKMNREQALFGMTIWAAYAAFQEKQKGTLEIGKWADVTVCDRDILNVPPVEILETKIVLSMVGGKTAFQAKELA